VSDKSLVLVGYSGHGFVVAEAAISAKMNLKYYSEIRELDLNPFDLEYAGFEGYDNFDGWKKDVDFILGIGNNKLRNKLARLILSKGKELKNVIHHSASISKDLIIGTGNFIARNTSVSPLVKIGSFCILNTGCIIEHECIIENSVHIAPGAVLAGNVIIGEGSFVGANAVIKQGVEIGKDVTIGAGAVIIKDISKGKKVVGNPSREI